MIYKIKILQDACFLQLREHDKTYFMMQNYNQLIEYFFPKIDYIIVENQENADICITSNGLSDNSVLSDNQFNIFISIENITNPEFNWYNHYNKYKEYNNNKINLYLYSHTNKILETINFLSIPCIHSRINYFNQNYKYYEDNKNLNKTFEEKKFCIMINKSNFNPLIKNVKNKLDSIEKVDSIADYSHLEKKSCYNSIELLEIFNQYKFVICFENSSNDGYITEKIFNCFFAKTIPLYWGSSKCNYYFNEKAYIQYDEKNNDWFDLIKNLNKDKSAYNDYIRQYKISESYNNENYKEKFYNFLNSYFL